MFSFVDPEHPDPADPLHSFTIPGSSALYSWVSGTAAVKEVDLPIASAYSRLALDSSGKSYIIKYNSILSWVPGSTALTEEITSGLTAPSAITFDSNGKLYIVDSGKTDYTDPTKTIPASVYSWTPGGTLTQEITSGLISPVLIKSDSKGTVYIADQGKTDYTDPSKSVPGKIYSWKPGSGTAPTETVASGFINGLSGIAFDSKGTLYIATADKIMSALPRFIPEDVIIRLDNHNTIESAKALNALYSTVGFVDSFTRVRDILPEQQQMALLQISPEFSAEVDILPKLQMMGLNRVVLDSAIVSSNNLTASSSSSIPTVKQGGIWTSAYGNWMKLNDTTDKRGSYLGYKSNTGGIAIGGHHQPNSQGLVGAFIGYGSGKTTNDIGMKATSDQYQGGVYAKYSPMKRGLFVSGLASYGYSNAKVNRAVNLGTMTDNISSKPKGNAMSSKLEIGYKIPAGNITIEPTGGIEYISRKTKAYSEISSLGTNLNLYMPARTNNNIVGSVGTKISANLGKTIPFLQVQYSSDLSSEKDYFYNINASFDAARDVIMSVQANMPKRNNLQITAGISSTFSYAHTFSISAASSISNNITNASASYAVRF